LKRATTALGNERFESIFDKENEFDISNLEFDYCQADTTSIYAPSKFILGIHLERIHNSNIFSGISTQGAPVLIRVNTSNATAITLNCVLVVVCDAMIIIDPITQSASVKW
jgi:hypothetical protein